jgi:transposase InsO family protein
MRQLKMEKDELALWRYGVIAPLLHRNPNISLSDMARQIAAEAKLLPDGRQVMTSVTTILRWFKRYQAGRLKALIKQPRADLGKSRALDKDSVACLMELALHSDWTIKAVHRQAQLQLGRSLPIKPVYRLLHGHRRSQPVEPARRRPIGIPQVLWLADTMHGPFVFGPHRKKHRSYLIVIFDDASRAVMAGRFSLNDDVNAFIPILRDAILARGLPHRLFVDNGPSYRSRVLRTACAQLGIHLVHATPYRPTSKARLERFFLTVRLQMLPRLPEFPAIEHLQTEWMRFLTQYHAAPHGTLTEVEGKPTSPLDYYLANLPDVRHVSEPEVKDLFMIEESRRVQADGTIRVLTRFFEVRPELAGSHVRVRFNPDQPNRVLYRPAQKPDALFQQAFPVE